MSANSKNANGSAGGGRKKGGGFLARQANTKAITEEELLKKDRLSPSDVLRLTRATESKSSTLDAIVRRPRLFLRRAVKIADWLFLRRSCRKNSTAAIFTATVTHLS